MALYDLENSTFHEPLPLDVNARGFQFSPDGNWIAMDWAEEKNRHIYLLSMEDYQLLLLKIFPLRYWILHGLCISGWVPMSMSMKHSVAIH